MTPATANPLVPTGYDMAWSAVAVLIVLLTLAAIWSITRPARRMPLGAMFGWGLLVVLIPVLGPVIWFVFGRDGRSRRVASTGEHLSSGRS